MIRPAILLVDDRPENLLTLESLLESPDLDLVRADSGEEALAKTLDHEFALVLLDVQMPGMDGYETAELMRGNKRTKHIPIIFVTAARKEQDHIFKGYDSGAVDYLFKPLEPAVLQSKVNVFLELYRRRRELQIKTRELDAKILELQELKRQLEASNEKLRMLSTVDGLTGLLNRRRFDEILAREWDRGRRDKTPLSLIMVDIDHFKDFNDHYGHIAGDQCLKTVAQSLAAALHRRVDLIARYGGEEFAAVLPDTTLEGAAMVAERMQRQIAALNLEHRNCSTGGRLTVSLGVSTILPNDETSPASLVDAADKALYQAKNSGRNCFRIYGR